MSSEGKGKMLRIYLNETVKHGAKPLYEAIVAKAYEKGVAGSMVFRGIVGSGFCCEFCRTTVPSLSEAKCQPMVIEFVDAGGRLDELVPVFKEMIKGGAMVMLDADIIHDVCPA